MNPTMQEDHATNLGHSGVLSQPLAIDSVRAEGFTLFDKTLGVPCHPLRFRQFHRLRKLSYESRMTVTPLHIILIGRLLPLLRIAICKTGVVHRRDVAKVAHDIHHFVIAKQAHDSPAGLWRFLSSDIIRSITSRGFGPRSRRSPTW